MAMPKRVWTTQGKRIPKVIADVRTDLAEQIMRQAIALIDASRKGPVDVKELVKADEAMALVEKRVLDAERARQAADRERTRRRALQGDNALDTNQQLP